MLRSGILPLAVILSAASTAESSPYYTTNIGPWGLDSFDTFQIRRKANKNSISEVKNTSTQKVVEEVSDELEQAEEAFFHAGEKVEHAIEKVIDDEVEMLFPHHADKSAEVPNAEVKSNKKKDKAAKVADAKSDVGDELELAEEAFFHAAEKVEHALEEAVDNEVEVLFPHHKAEE
eukprot:759525_1